MASLFSRLVLALLLLGLLTFWSYRTPPQPPPAEASVENAMLRPAPTLTGSYLAARHASMHSDSRAASDFLSQALTHAPQDKELTTQAVRNLLMAGDLDRAVKLAREKTAMEVKSPIIHMTLFIDEARQGNWELADKHLQNIRAYGLQAITLPYLQAWTQLGETGTLKLPKAPLQLKQSFYDSFQYFQTGLLADAAGEKELAAESYDKMLADMAVVPGRFVTVAVQFYLREGNEARATEIYEDYLNANSGDLTRQAVSVPEAIAALKNGKGAVRNAKDGVAEVMLTMASMLHAEMVDREALVYAQLGLSMRPDLGDAHYLLGEIYETSGKKKIALQSYDAVPKDSPLHRHASLRRALLLDETGHTQQAIQMLQQMARTEPRPSDVYMTLADLLRGQEKYQDAARAYTQAIEALGPVKPQHWPLFFTRGISYERAGEWEKAEADLLRAFSLEPEQPDVKNYLAYSWLLMGKNMDKATEMLEQASLSRPDDGHIIDSLAWAHYLTGNYEKALALIEQAVEIMPHDATVNDHYGDILWRAGRRTEARYQWERALAFKPEPKDKSAIEQKLVAGLPAAPAARPTSTASSAAPSSAVAHP
jgi:tetratricopeptide (TPR) repeat protein